jgi:hypothetical protein
MISSREIRHSKNYEDFANGKSGKIHILRAIPSFCDESLPGVYPPEISLSHGFPRLYRFISILPLAFGYSLFGLSVRLPSRHLTYFTLADLQTDPYLVTFFIP